MTYASSIQSQWKQFLYTDGISSNYIFQTHKDDRGRIWIGTQNGITLFNGLEIKKFGSEHGLPSADITFINNIGRDIYVATANRRMFKFNDNEKFEKQKSFKEIRFTLCKKLMGNCLYPLI